MEVHFTGRRSNCDAQTTAKAVIVIEGKFDSAKINAAAADVARRKGQNVTIDKIDGKTVYKLSGENQPAPMFATVLDSKMIVMASAGTASLRQ